MLRICGHTLAILVLTILTQLGGLAWLASLFFRRRMLAFGALYVCLSLAASIVAPLMGRVALSCWQDGPLKVQSIFYCAANRTYVTPELAQVLLDAAEDLNEAFPGTDTLVLDAGFPFADGFPLLPHLSHDDGEKADLAFYYRDKKDGYLKGRTLSPVGYWGFEEGETYCPDAWPTLRWNFRWLQPLLRDRELEPHRSAALLSSLAADERVGKILLEPHLEVRLAVQSDKIRFQGCRAARHDDHIHLQL